MKINRDILLQKIINFSIEGSGVIIGKPGVGKSYLLKELRKQLYEQSLISFLVKIDTVVNASDVEITKELGLEDDWISTLRNIPIENNQKIILIFDAFDAARNELIREQFLAQIRKAKLELADTCNIIVSVRTYDAYKSPEFIKLFPLKNNSIDSFNCRKIEITELTNEEIVDAINGNDKLLKFYNESSNELKEILKIPFFLTLLENILNYSLDSELESIKKYKSENQLLNFYWEKKIVNTNNYILKEQFLIKLTNDLIERRSLNILKTNLFNLFPGFPQDIFTYLRSENIIDEVSNNTRLIFSHNIYFDYAVSLYVIPFDSISLLSFINNDKTRPFFLRPSFIYFFTTLWYDERGKFWNFYFQLSKEESKEIQLLVRLILNGVIVSEYSNIEELNFIIHYDVKTQKPILIRNILQSIRFSKQKLKHIDVELLFNMSQELEGSDFYIFDFSFLLERAIEGLTQSNNDKEKCGIAARSLLSYILNQRNSTNKYFLDRIGAYRGIELVAKTYSTNKIESKTVLSRVFQMLDEPAFEIQYFSQLAESVKFFVDDDPDFVAHIYKAIFGHYESSQEETIMGGSVLMNFRSNRRQDFEMCYFRLEQFFPTFLNSSPSIAISVGLDIVNSDSEQEASNYNRKEELFLYKGEQLSYIADLSSIWATGTLSLSHRSAKLAIKIVEFISKLISQNQNYRDLVFEYIKNAKTAFVWKELLKLGVKYPNELKHALYPLLTTPVFIRNFDTRYETKELIEKLIETLNDSEIESIENAFFLAYDESNTNSLISALSSIPFEKLQLERSKTFMQDKERLTNEPDVQFTTSVTDFTNEQWLEEKGVDFKNPVNAELSGLTNNLSKFNNEFLNATPQANQYKSSLLTAKEIYSKLDSPVTEIQEDLYFSALREISQTFAIITRNLSDIGSDDYTLIRSVLIKCFLFESKYENDESNSAQFGWSPTPKVNASEALFNLYEKDKDSESFELYLKALEDKSSIIRYHSSKSLIKLTDIDYEKYWKILLTRLKKENDSFVYASLLNNIKFQLDKLQSQAKEIIEIISEKSKFLKGDVFIENYSSVLIWLLRAHKNEEAKTKLLQASDNVRLCNTIIFKFFEALHPSYPQNEFLEHPEQFYSIIEILEQYINYCFTVLKSVGDEEFNSENQKVKDSLSIINQIIVRIFFQLDEARVGRQNFKLPVNVDNRRAFYFLIKPLYLKIIALSSEIKSGGLITGDTAHYFIQSLNKVLPYDAKDILSMISTITKLAASTGYTFDSLAIREMVSITEKLFADYRDLLLQDDSFKNLINLLDLYINSGWTEALELLWKLDEVFK